MTIQTTLTLKDSITLPVEANSITPDRFVGLSQAQVEVLPVLKGRRWVTISDLFAVRGDGAREIILKGDLGHVKRIGQGMTRGRITIQGDVGMHLGAEMRGGEIEARGNVGAWAGAEMAGGLIRIRGNAGAMLGAAYTGEKLGMRDGVIIVDGEAGVRAGERMRRGLIVVQGSIDEFAGVRMVAGSIIILGKLGARAGAGMKRGTIVALGGLVDGLLPTFHHACTYQPTFLRHYLRRLQAWGIPVTQEHMDGFYQRYTGDVNTIGKGEILVYD